MILPSRLALPLARPCARHLALSRRCTRVVRDNQLSLGTLLPPLYTSHDPRSDEETTSSERKIKIRNRKKCLQVRPSPPTLRLYQSTRLVHAQCCYSIDSIVDERRWRGIAIEHEMLDQEYRVES